MMEGAIVIPGDYMTAERLKGLANPSALLRLGPGLRHIPPETISPTVAGEICIDGKKNAIWVEGSGGRVCDDSFLVGSKEKLTFYNIYIQYIPTTGDNVLVIVHHSSPDVYVCAITAHTPYAQLPQLAFENASKKSRPMLGPGSLVYARISLANKHMDPELECAHPTTGRAEGLGELKGGMVFNISLGMARRLMMPDPAKQGNLVVLDDLAEKIPFEIAVGRNGRVWICASGGHVQRTLAVGRAVVETDQARLGIDQQRKTVRRLLKVAGL